MLREKSSNSVKIISIDRDKVLARLRQIANKIIAERWEVKQIHLFGSLARGDQVGTSDADILIVVNNNILSNPLEQAQTYYPFFDLPIGVDILIMDEENFQLRLQNEDVFISRVWQEGITLVLRNG